MAKPLVFKKSIRIDAPASLVWDALTRPELTKKYMFGSEAISEWKVGSALTWRFVQEGKKGKEGFLKGTIIIFEPGKRLAFTIFNPQRHIPDIPANYTMVTYELVEKDHGTTVTVSDGDFASIPDGEKRYAETIQGWGITLPKLKAVVEEMVRNR